MIISSIISASELPKAALMADSVKKHMPYARVVICLVEQEIGKEALEIQVIDDIVLAKDVALAIGFQDFERYLFKYQKVQCASAMKAQLLSYLQRYYTDERHIVYMDPDMYVLGGFTELEEQLWHHDVLLVPHHLEPSPSEDCSREIGTLKDGTFHGGLVAVQNNEEGRRFADWWAGMIASDYKDQSSGMFADQRWLNFVPSFFNAVVLRHPGYNIAFWNLHEAGRQVHVEQNSYWTSHGLPVRCVHFSNFMGLLDGCLNSYLPDPELPLHQLRLEYESLLSALSYDRWAEVPWSYDYYYCGEQIEAWARERYCNEWQWNHPRQNPFHRSNSDFT